MSHSTIDQERILLIGDRDRHVHQTLSQVLPSAEVTLVPTYFDAICELNAGGYTSVLASAEPIEKRPEAAVKVIRELIGDGRLMLFGHPSLEPLSRKMLEFGSDDYIVTPVNPSELQQMLGTPPLRLATAEGELPLDDDAAAAMASTPGSPTQVPTRIATLLGLPLAEIVLDAMYDQPQGATDTAIRQINSRLSPTMRLHRIEQDKPAPQVPEGMRLLSHALREEANQAGLLHLLLPLDEDETAARHALAQIGHALSRLLALEERHKKLQRLAITDDLTGIYNGRYFRHMLGQLIQKAKDKRFTVTLLLFDIDNFKSYNDRYGHGVGDEILKQTAALMRRCCRPHDVVARISGDEFAVVFWEKEGPRTPRDPNTTQPGGRVPSSVRAVCDRFRRLVSSPDFGVLGATGKGTLTISGGLAVYPFDATSVDSLIEAADRALMFDAKKSGKNSIFLVGSSDPGSEV
jgi:two-component system, cell cycle response regulator